MASDLPDVSSSAIFKKNWQRYRTVMAHNLMYHREIYCELHRVLVEEAPRPFRFLDIACGDASCTVEALEGTDVAAYHGIDLSQPALDLAHGYVENLGCPFKLENRDFVDAVAQWSDAVDVVWIGQSLHHLRLYDKRKLVQKIRSMLSPQGLFLIWEPTRLEGESEDGWYDRFVSNRPLWSVLSDEDFADIDNHHRTSDHPETAEGWRTLGTDAGFARVDELFRSPNDLARLYSFKQ